MPMPDMATWEVILLVEFAVTYLLVGRLSDRLVIFNILVGDANLLEE
jgi:hypothetical protein